MNIHFPKVCILAIIITSISISLGAQNHFTPYDELPSLVKNHKPAFRADMPSWAKMLYDFPVNFFTLQKEFDVYERQHPDLENPIIRYYKQWSRAIGPYVMSDGSIQMPNIAEIHNRLRNQISQTHQIITDVSRDDNKWTFWGPKETYWLNESGQNIVPDACPWQVNVYSIDVAATNPNVVYAGTETGYINKSVDKGMSWQLVSQHYYTGGGVTCIAIHPQNPDVVYAAAGRQMHKSIDGGLTWKPILTNILFGADEIKIDASNPQNIYCAGGDGLFISKDEGKSWEKKWNASVYDIELKPNDSNKLMALVKDGSNFGLIISENGGQSFTSSATFPSNFFDESGGLLAVSNNNPDLLMAALLSKDNTPILLKGVLTNGAYTWTQKAIGNTTQLPLDNWQGYYDLGFEISPTNQNIIYIGTGSLYKSVNGGINFSAVGGYDGNFPIHPDVQDIRLLDNGDSWIVTDGGVNYTTDHFTKQENYSARNNGIVGSDFWGFDQGWNEDIIVGGRYHNGNTSIADFYQPKSLRMGGAESPTGWVINGKSRHVAFDDLGSGWILPKKAEGNPEGRFLFTKFPNMEEYGGRRGNLVHHPYYSNTLYVGTGNDIWQSSDMGQTWDLMHTFSQPVRYMHISFSNPDVMYADIDGDGFYRSADGGINWTKKKALTTSPIGSNYWAGKTFFAISPYDENTVYACLQNGTWSSDIGNVYKSTDGGDTWMDYTGSINAYMKCMIVQPTSDGKDMVYLFTNAISGKPATVFYRDDKMNDWSEYDEDYPKGIQVNHALPFFRDGKMRVAGGAGVWEAPLLDQDYEPILNPWIDHKEVSCFNDTIYLEDHSIINHVGASWHWTITPVPSWIENENMRNPKVVLGAEGKYTVKMDVSQGGKTYSKTIEDAIVANKCPSIFDCNNPDILPKKEWNLVYADSEETGYPGLAAMAFDNDVSTIWHTRWSTGEDPYPHEIIIDMGKQYNLFSFIYQTRTDGENGRIKDYELYISDDATSWNNLADKNTFENTAAPQIVNLDAGTKGRYIRLLALSEVNNGPWASAAEFYVKGCVIDANFTNEAHDSHIKSYPMPVTNDLHIDLPIEGMYDINIYNNEGRLVKKANGVSTANATAFDVSYLNVGAYFVIIKFNNGITYRMKIVKS